VVAAEKDKVACFGPFSSVVSFILVIFCSIFSPKKNIFYESFTQLFISLLNMYNKYLFLITNSSLISLPLISSCTCYIYVSFSSLL
jgi:hypothetical protein